VRADWKYYRGDVYLADLNGRFGAEQAGVRPVVVLQNNIANIHAPIISVVPMTSIIKKTHLPTHYVFDMRSPVLRGLSMVMAEQTTTIDKQRLISYIGKLNAKQMQGVEKAVLHHLGFEEPDEHKNCESVQTKSAGLEVKENEKN